MDKKTMSVETAATKSTFRRVWSWKKSCGCSIATILAMVMIYSLFCSSSQLSELKQQQPQQSTVTKTTDTQQQKLNSLVDSPNDGTGPTSILPDAKDDTNTALIMGKNGIQTPSNRYQNQIPSSSTLSSSSSAVSFNKNKPRTQLDNTGDDCRPTPMRRGFQRRSFPAYANVTNFVNGVGRLVSHQGQKKYYYALCEFQDQVPNAHHFTHSFQQIYGCWSYWQEQCFSKPHSESKLVDDSSTRIMNNITATSTNNNCFYQPVLIMTNGVETKLTKNPFLRGFLESLKSEMNLLVIGRRRFLESHVNLDDPPLLKPQEEEVKYDTSNLPVAHISVKGGYAIQYAPILRDLVRSHYSIQGVGDQDGDGKHNLRHRPSPRVGILNRRKPVGRSILNAERLAKEVELALGHSSSSNNNSVTVMYFEGKSFEEQVAFFSSVDILISPHGAQLTGIPFLGRSLSSSDSPTPKRTCGALLELFPKGYLIPEFFGSLAVSSGLQYGYLYLSEGYAEAEQAENLLNRIHARATNLCPPLPKVVDAVKALIHDWETCLSSPPQ